MAFWARAQSASLPPFLARAALLALLCVPAAGSASAQDAPAPYAAVLVAPGSTRALGMGGAFVLGATDADAVFVNAAFHAQLRGLSLGVSRFGGAADGALGFTAAAGTAWWRGAVGVGVRALGAGGAGGSAAAAGSAATLAYGLTVLGVRIAAGASLLEQSHEGRRGSGVAFDAAVGRNLGPFALGLAARNMGADVTLGGGDAGARKLPVPERFGATAATRALPVGPLDVTAAAAWQTDLDGSWSGGAGVEAAYWPIQGRTFAARAGVHRGADDHEAHATLGAGFRGDALSLDWAWQDGGGAVHRVSVSWR